VSWRTASASRARRAGPVGHAAWKPSSRLRIGDCSALAESDQRTDPRRARDVGESAGTRIVHMPYVVEQDEGDVWSAPPQLCPGPGSRRCGPTAEAAVADLRNTLEALQAEAGRIPHDRALSGRAGHPQRDFPAPGPGATSGFTALVSSTRLRGRRGAASLPAARPCCRSRPATAR
jgi:hypothetical protein